jgi:hypothetical protein
LGDQRRKLCAGLAGHALAPLRQLAGIEAVAPDADELLLEPEVDVERGVAALADRLARDRDLTSS